MKLALFAVPAAALIALSLPAAAQTTTQTKVDHDTNVSKSGVTTHKTTVTHTTKRKTRQPKKVLGVKVGHKTATSKVVKTTKVSSDGDASTTVKTSN